VEDVEKRDEASPPWYRDSAAAAVEDVQKREAVSDSASPPWYRESPAAAAEDLSVRSQDDTQTAGEAKMDELRKAAFEGMRDESLRVKSERGKAFFEFTLKPRNDTVDRWHIPESLRNRYDNADSDADRVSILNMYLYVTGRTPLPATVLGFTPTMMLPGLPEGGNEVGYGYALSGQHQYHCAEFLADAIELGKDNINDFYLQHVIHCLGLVKHLAGKLTDPEPLTLLNPEAEALVKAKIPQTREGYKKGSCQGLEQM
jgi:hypothetical protein